MQKTIKYFIIAMAIYFLTLFIFRLEPFFLYNNDFSKEHNSAFMNIEEND
ncbi:MAG: hypothetical protein U9Q66_01810 [Patescibacteria group bacterium]|nr:hypothetical protein [Patescibacteria group bacterium]